MVRIININTIKDVTEFLNNNKGLIEVISILPSHSDFFGTSPKKEGLALLDPTGFKSFIIIYCDNVSTYELYQKYFQVSLHKQEIDLKVNDSLLSYSTRESFKLISDQFADKLKEIQIQIESPKSIINK